MIPKCDLIFVKVTHSLKGSKGTFSTLKEELPKRIKCPITVTTEISGVKSTRTYNPFDQSYNLALMSFTASVKKRIA